MFSGKFFNLAFRLASACDLVVDNAGVTIHSRRFGSPSRLNFVPLQQFVTRTGARLDELYEALVEKFLHRRFAMNPCDARVFLNGLDGPRGSAMVLAGSTREHEVCYRRIHSQLANFRPGASVDAKEALAEAIRIGRNCGEIGSLDISSPRKTRRFG